MPQIERKTLERAISLRKARAIVDCFYNDRMTYPDENVHWKRGVCKILAEEYSPLVRLAHEYCCVRSVRLLPEANPGPDGEIRLWWRQSSKVQIICANEGYNRALMRELLANGNIGFRHQNRHRDKVTKKVVSTGRALTTPDADIQMRVERILKAINAKEEKYYSATDTLLVQEDPADFIHLKEGGPVHRKVCDAIRKGLGLPYRRIYINYGNELKRIK